MLRKRLAPVLVLTRNITTTILLFIILLMLDIPKVVYNSLPNIGKFDFIYTLSIIILLYKLASFITTFKTIDYDEKYVYITNKLRRYDEKIELSNMLALTLHQAATFTIAGSAMFWGCTLVYNDNQGVKDQIEFYQSSGNMNFSDFINRVKDKNPNFIYKSSFF
jgi:hypothetical protein